MARPDDNGMIVCTGCDRELPGTLEYYHRRGDAFKPQCKECRGTDFGVQHPTRVYDIPDGQHMCVGCDRILPADPHYFHRTKATDIGFVGRCKECRGQEFGIIRPNRIYPHDEKRICKSCEALLPETNAYFYRRSDGLEYRCKPCSAFRRNDSRRAKRLGADHNLTGAQWNSIKEIWAGDDGVRCAYCGTVTDQPERDHVIPLGRGDTTVRNIVPACSRCNRSKSDHPVSEWYPGSGYYDPVRWELIQRHIRGDTLIPR